MIGREDENQEVVLRVSDRRKFNPDGSLRDGVVIEETPKKEEKPVEAAPKSEPETVAAEAKEEPIVEPELEGTDEEETADDKDPASFVNFVSMLATNAMAALGAMPNPATGQRTLDLDSGKYWIDIIKMVREKTNGNLNERESRMIEGLLAELQMQYVQMVRYTEERLKQQAAHKFSANDVLGRK